MTFQAVTPLLIAALRDAVGADCVHVDEDTITTCASDVTEVSAVMRLALEHHVPVTPRGAGTGLSGGALPVHGGIVLATRALNRILEIDTTNLMAVVEPG